MLCLLCFATLISCTHRVAGNHPHIGYLNFEEKETGEFLTEDFYISTETKTYSHLTENHPTFDWNSYIYYGGTAPRYNLDNVPEGYEGVIPYLEDLELDTEASVIEVYGIVAENILTGYVNVYKDTIGYLSGGGNYGVEEIDHSLVFYYDKDTDTFSTHTELKGVMIVGLNGDYVVYWKNKGYYLYDIVTEMETFLIEDKAYDSGLQHQSRSYILTNDQYTLIVMVKAKGANEEYSLYLVDYQNLDFYELTLEKEE